MVGVESVSCWVLLSWDEGDWKQLTLELRFDVKGRTGFEQMNVGNRTGYETNRQAW